MQKLQRTVPLFSTVAAAAVTMTGATLLGEDARYRVVVIPPPPGASGIEPADINNSNQVVGFTYVNGDRRPFMYSDGASIVLDDVPGTFTDAAAINDRGQVTGSMYTPMVLRPEAYLWDENGVQPLGSLESGNSYGNSLNEHGEVVGRFHPRGGWYIDGFVYMNGQLITLEPGGSEAWDINKAGQVVGGSSSAILWEPDGQGGFTPVYLDGVRADAINEIGTVIAGAGPALAYVDSAAFWRLEDGRWIRTDVGDWDPFEFVSCANDVNDAEQIVGFREAHVGGESRGFLYEGEKLSWLTDRLSSESSSWEVKSAIAINEAGHIVAAAKRQGGLTEQVLLVPATLSVLGPRPGIAGRSNELIATSATPGERVHFVYGLFYGSSDVPGCPGLAVDVRSPRIVGSAIATPNMEARITAHVPAAAAGRAILLQAVEPSTCTVSDVLRYELR